MEILKLGICLVCSIVVYLFFPLCYRYSKGKVNKNKGKKIALINSIVCAFLFIVLEIIIRLDPISGGIMFAPAVLYYYISKSILIEKELSDKIVFDTYGKNCIHKGIDKIADKITNRGKKAVNYNKSLFNYSLSDDILLCKKCGMQLFSENEQCPYCGMPNPYFKNDLFDKFKRVYNIEEIKKCIDGELIKKSLKNYFYDQYSEEEILSALKDCNIIVSKTNNNFQKLFLDKMYKTETSSKISRYKFKGHLYKKSRLVLAVVKDYVNNHKTSTIEELKKVFPKKLQKQKFGVIEDKLVVDKKIMNNAGTSIRYFVNDSIHVADGYIYVCNQWCSGQLHNIEEFIAHARKLGYVIEEC